MLRFITGIIHASIAIAIAITMMVVVVSIDVAVLLQIMIKKHPLIPNPVINI